MSNDNDGTEIESKKYRVVAMIPTEIYINGTSTEDAYSTMDWLFEQYPGVDAPMASESEHRAPLAPRVMTIENV